MATIQGFWPGLDERETMLLKYSLTFLISPQEAFDGNRELSLNVTVDTSGDCVVGWVDVTMLHSALLGDNGQMSKFLS